MRKQGHLILPFPHSSEHSSALLDPAPEWRPSGADGCHGGLCCAAPFGDSAWPLQTTMVSAYLWVKKLLLLKVLDTWYLYKIPENSFFKTITWEHTLIELHAYSS